MYQPWSLQCDGPWLKDASGRVVLLRGANVGGSSKVPRYPDGASHRRDGFFDHRRVSFVDRPFPLAEADEHFARLRRWGLTCLRLVVPWEAIEHDGPGVYDEAYLDYLDALIARAADHELAIIIDPHQDVWSRFTGGDGAPGWTLEAVGFDLTRFAATGAALLHATTGERYPPMIWPTNGWKLGAATMFTLFFGGDDFAPQTLVDGEPVQQFLQRHYLAAFQHLAARLCRHPNLIGYETMNEPLAGWIGIRDLSAPVGLPEQGYRPSPFQAMLLGAGFPQSVGFWNRDLRGPRRIGQTTLNPGSLRAWQPGLDCIWRSNGVWDLDGQGRPRLLRPHHFVYVGRRRVDFSRDYLKPFSLRFIQAMRNAHPQTLIFLQGEATHPDLEWSPTDPPQMVFAPHWYDLLLLFARRYLPWAGIDAHAGRLILGELRVRQAFAKQVRRLRQHGTERIGAPTVIGEFGVPFDMDSRTALHTDDFRRPARALDRSFQAIEAGLVGALIWNYTADNTDARGDRWNKENLSIFSRDRRRDPTDPDSGGRALNALVRPYPARIAGEPLMYAFDMDRSRFVFRFRHDPSLNKPTEIFVPGLHYRDGCRISVSDGSYRYDPQAQVLFYYHDPTYPEHEVHLCDGSQARGLGLLSVPPHTRTVTSEGFGDPDAEC